MLWGFQALAANSQEFTQLILLCSTILRLKFLLMILFHTHPKTVMIIPMPHFGTLSTQVLIN